LSSPVKITLVQLQVARSKRENLRSALAAIDMTPDDAGLVVFPEYSMSYPIGGLTRDYVKSIAEPLDGEFVTRVAEKSEEKQVGVVLPIFEKKDGGLFNTAVIIDRGEVKGGYRKIHLYDAFGYNESKLFHAGSSLVLFKISGLTFGLAICYDIRFPELMKCEAKAGAYAIVVPSAWYRGPLKEEQWQTLLVARAQENTSYVIGVGNANSAFVGRSTVVDPFGVKVLDLGAGNRIGSCEIEKSRVTEARRKLPVLKQSRRTYRYRQL